MPTDKRLRQRSGRQERLEMAREAQARAKRRRQFALMAGGLVALALVFVAISVFGKSTPVETSSTGSTTTTSLVEPKVDVPAGPAPTTLGVTDIKVGTGRAVRSGDRVEVQYVGVDFRTHEKFDSSYDRGGEPFKFLVGHGDVIKGWDEGIVGMKVGGRRRLVVPNAMAYGNSPAGDKIKAGDSLVFVIDLEKITPTTFKYGTGPCAPHLRPKTPPTTFAAAPKQCHAPGYSPKAYITTSEGQFVVQLDGDKAPGAVNNFVELTNWGYYDFIEFHRIVKGFMSQTGRRGTNETPGYSIPDELASATGGYPKYSVAMANTGQPDTGGSQWFVCTDCSSLPPQYTLFGKVVEGFGVIDKINALGTADEAGTPTKKVVLQGVDII